MYTAKYKEHCNLLTGCDFLRAQTAKKSVSANNKDKNIQRLTGDI
jgi:hypothetical protein